jgi:hypothetical protein
MAVGVGETVGLGLSVGVDAGDGLGEGEKKPAPLHAREAARHAVQMVALPFLPNPSLPPMNEPGL